MYADQDALQAGFFAELRSALPKDNQWNDLRKSIGDFGASISPLGKLGALVGMDFSTIMAEFSERLSGDSSVFKTKSQAEKALRAFQRPILVIMDDLDRLTPSELLLVFKLVRLVGRLPNVYYLLCYDEKTLLDVLRRTDLVGDDEARAKDYLEKMVQVRLDLPVIRSHQTNQLIDQAFASVLGSNEIELGPDAIYRIQSALREHLRLRLNTPRSINRLFGQVDAFYSMISAEVDFVDFFLMTFIRTMEHGAYSLLQENRGELTSTDLMHLTDKRTHAERAASWRERLRDAGVRSQNIEGVLKIMAGLFLPVRSAMSNSGYGDYYLEEIGRRRGVGHTDYFDRYFTFGVPDEDIADSLVSEAMKRLHSGETGPAIVKFRDQLVHDSSRVMRKLRTLRDAGALPVSELLTVLAETYASLPVNSGVFEPEPRWDFEVFGRELIRTLDLQAGTNAIEAMASSELGIHLVARIIEGLHGEENIDPNSPPERYLAWHQSAQTSVLRLVQARLESAATVPVYEVTDAVWMLIWDFYRLDNSDCRAWMRSCIEIGPWTLLDVISRFTSVTISRSSDGSTQPALGDLDLAAVDEIFGLPVVLQALENEIEDAPELLSRLAPDVTPQGRRVFVLNSLRRERNRRNAGGTEQRE
jgi:KAP family P-loop domain